MSCDPRISIGQAAECVKTTISVCQALPQPLPDNIPAEYITYVGANCFGVNSCNTGNLKTSLDKLFANLCKLNPLGMTPGTIPVVGVDGIAVWKSPAAALGAGIQGQPGQFLATNGSSVYFADPIDCQSLGTKLKTCLDTFSTPATTYLGLNNGVIGYYRQATVSCADVTSKLLDLNCVGLSTAIPTQYLGQVGGALAWVLKPKETCAEFLANLTCIPVSQSVPTEVVGTVNGAFALMPYPVPKIDCKDLKDKLSSCIPSGTAPAVTALTMENGAPVFSKIDTTIKCPDLLDKLKTCVGASAIPADNTLTYQNGVLVRAPIDTSIKCPDLIAKLQSCATPGAANPSTVLSIQGGQLITAPLNLALKPSEVNAAIVTTAAGSPSSTPATSVLTIVNGVVTTAPLDTTIQCSDLKLKLSSCIQSSNTLTTTAVTIVNGTPVLATIDTSIKCADLVAKLISCGANNVSSTPATSFLTISNGQLVTAPLPATANGIVCSDLISKLTSCATPTTQTFSTALTLSGGVLYNATIDTTIKCADLLSKLQSCSVTVTSPVTNVLSFVNGTLVYAPLPASASGIVCSDLLAKLSSCSVTTNTPSTTFLSLSGGQLTTAPINYNAVIAGATPGNIASAVVSGIGSSPSPATSVVSIVGGQLVNSPIPAVGTAANTTSISNVPCTDFTAKLSGCAVTSSTPSSTALALVGGNLVSVPVSATTLTNVSCSDLSAKLSSCAAASTSPATSYLALVNGNLVQAPLPTGVTSANTSSISAVPASEICGKLIACAASSSVNATSVLTIQSGVVVLAPIAPVATNTSSVSGVVCSDFIGKLVACTSSSSVPSATYLTYQSGQLVSAPLPPGGIASDVANITSVPASQVCAKLIACRTITTTVAATALTIQGGQIVEAPLPTNVTAADATGIASVPAAQVCAKLVACTGNSTTPATSVMTIQSGAIVLAPLPTGGTSANTSSISAVPASEVCAKLVSCAVNSTIAATNVLTVQNGVVALAPLPTGVTAGDTTGIASVPASQVCAKLVACAGASTVPASTVMTVQNGLVVLAPFPAAGTSSNTSSISGVPASEICAKLISCAANSSTPASNVLTVQSGAVVLAPLPTGGVASDVANITSVPAAQVCAKLAACAATSTTAATSVMTVQNGNVVLAPFPAVSCSDVMSKIASCPTNSVPACTRVNYLLGGANNSNTVDRVLSRFIETYALQCDNNIDTTVYLNNVLVPIVFKYPGNASCLESKNVGCNNTNTISHSTVDGYFTFSREMYATIDFNTGVEVYTNINPSPGANPETLWGVNLEIVNAPHSIISTPFSGTYPVNNVIMPSGVARDILSCGSWSGYFGAGAKVRLIAIGTSATSPGKMTFTAGKRHFSITEHPRLGFNSY